IMRRAAVIVLLVATVATGARPAAAQLPPLFVTVPATQPTVQAGIDAVASGGVVIVAAGIYHENVTYRGKGVDVRSASGPALTVIDGGGIAPAVQFTSGEGRGSALRGFTVR